MVWTIGFDLFLNLLFQIIIKLFGFSIFWNFNLINYFILFFFIHNHLNCIHIIPISWRLLNIQKLISRIIWFLLIFFITEIQLLSFNIEFQISCFFSLIISYKFLSKELFVPYFEIKNHNRIKKLQNIFEINFFFIIFLSILFFIFNQNIIIFIIFIKIFLFNEFLVKIISIIFGENVSFSSNNHQRLFEGLKSRNPYIQFLAFEDLYYISENNYNRREFLFKNPTGYYFNYLIQDIILPLFNSYKQKHQFLHQIGSSKIPLHLLNNQQWRHMENSRFYNQRNSRSFSPIQNQININNINNNNKIQKILKRILFIVSKEEMEQYQRETLSIEYSIFVILSIQTIINFIFLFPKEDKFGIGQKHIEQILESLINLKRELEITLQFGFILPPFNNKWICNNSIDLILKTKSIVDWGITEIRKQFKNQVDFSKLSKENQEFLK